MVRINTLEEILRERKQTRRRRRRKKKKKCKGKTNKNKNKGKKRNGCNPFPLNPQRLIQQNQHNIKHTRVGTLIVATIYLQLIQNRYMFRSFTVLQCGHQHCVQPIANDVEVVGYL